jgi:hypothetical protein
MHGVNSQQSFMNICRYAVATGQRLNLMRALAEFVAGVLPPPAEPAAGLTALVSDTAYYGGVKGFFGKPDKKNTDFLANRIKKYRFFGIPDKKIQIFWQNGYKNMAYQVFNRKQMK